VLAAGGVVESAYLKHAELTRSVINNEEADIKRISINLANALENKPADNIALESKDRLNVLKIPAWSENLTVNLVGEFRFPGKYTIRRGEKLSALIAKAGGITDYGFARGAVFTRVKLKAIERNNLQKVAQDLRVEMAAKGVSNSNDAVAFDEANKLIQAIMNVEPIGRLVLDVENVLQDPNYDIELEDGDTLYMPTFNNTINVIGQVQVTTAHLYNPSLSIDDYLTKSGGIKDRADEDKIYIVSANGNIRMLKENAWFSTSQNYRLQPGDTIVVPLDSDYTDNLTLWSKATGILYNTAIAAAAIKAF
jgi:polysaccharide export outer membrane protein